MKLVNRNTGHAQVIGVILCHFHNCYIISGGGEVYFFQVTLTTPYNQVPSNSMVVFKRLHLNLLNIMLF